MICSFIFIDRNVAEKKVIENSGPTSLCVATDHANPKSKLLKPKKQNSDSVEMIIIIFYVLTMEKFVN